MELPNRVNQEKWLFLVLLFFVSIPAQPLHPQPLHQPTDRRPPCDGIMVKNVIDDRDAGENLLKPDAWKPWHGRFERRGSVFVCDNGTDAQVQRGVSQTVILDQTVPAPIAATAWSKAEQVGGSRNSDYSLYLDLVYSDGSPLWGQVDSFNVGTHDWEKAKVVVFPDKPIKSVSFYMLLRGHSGKAWFRDPELRVLRPPKGTHLFDGVPVSVTDELEEGFQVRDVKAKTDFVSLEHRVLELELKYHKLQTGVTTFFDVTLSDTSGKDRAVTLIYTVPIAAKKCAWLQDPRHGIEIQPDREYIHAARLAVGSNGRLSRYPFAAVATDEGGIGLGIDMAWPAFFRVGAVLRRSRRNSASGPVPSLRSGSKELFLAYDLGLAPEKHPAI